MKGLANVSIEKNHPAVELTGAWQVAQHKHPEDAALPAAAAMEWIDATVPGAVQYDLVAAGRLTNPFAGTEAAKAAAWVAASDWLFRRSFLFDRSSLAGGEPHLEIEGIDTFADIWLNGTKIGTTANAYRSYLLPIDPALLRDGANAIVVHVKAHERMIAAMVPEAQKRLGPTYNKKNLIRRYQRSFFGGSSLLNVGAEVLGIGIYKPLRIVVVPPLRIADAHFRVMAAAPAEATARIDVTLAGAAKAAKTLRVTATLTERGAGTAAGTAAVSIAGGKGTLTLSVANPSLWWPRGYGAQDLYTLRIDLHDGDRLLDSRSETVGIKTVSLVTTTASGRPTFQLRVNGTDIHVRGHNLVPIDYIKVHGSWEEYERCFRLMCDSNANLLRIWGGGAIESERFYDACDELGIMLFQDFFLHSTTYPDYDAAWVEEFRQESVELARRLRNRACLTLLCGGNEQHEGWDEWGWRGRIDRFYGETLATELLPKVAAAEAPEIPYIVNSPHGGNTSQSPILGEVHCWGNFYNSTKDPLFVTETCWNIQSYSRPETLQAVMGLKLEDFSEVGWPEKWHERTNLSLIARNPYGGGPIVTDNLRDYIEYLQTEHALADHHALSMLRLRSPSCNGIIYWPLNKGGPLFEFGCVDYRGYPLANYYAVKRLFADVAIGVYRDINDIRVVGSNLGRDEVAGELVVTHLRADGTALGEWRQAVRLAAGQNARLTELSDHYAKVVDRSREVVRARFDVAGRTVAEDTLFFCPLSDFATAPDSIQASAARSGDGWDIRLKASAVVKMVRIEGNQKWLLSDNYFALHPGGDRTVHASLLERTSDAAPVITVAATGSREQHELSLK